jgi:AcrR family transcriptional regulator
LLAATSALIAEQGLEAATVRRIAAAAGCTTGLVTHYFRSKDELLIDVIRTVHEQAAERMRALSAGARGLAALRAVLLEALPLDPRSVTDWRIWLAFWGYAWTSPAVREEHRVRYAIWRRSVRGLLAQAVQDGETPQSLDVDAAAERIIALIDGLGLQATYEPDRLPPARLTAIVDAELSRLAEPAETRPSARTQG